MNFPFFKKRPCLFVFEKKNIGIYTAKSTLAWFWNIKIDTEEWLMKNSVEFIDVFSLIKTILHIHTDR